ncbi:MAG: hypothetical protein KKA84_07520 [Bacteroidetes bacterium]|nr:hypothetical protein [Bacteroidota bacterium]
MKTKVSNTEEINKLNDRERLRIFVDRAQREYDLLIGRTSIFMLYNSILMAGFALSKNIPMIVKLLPVLGLISCLVWIYIGQRSIMTAQYFWNKVLKTETLFRPVDRIFTDFFEWRKATKAKIFGFPITTYIGRIFPYLWFITWTIVAILDNRFIFLKLIKISPN